MTVDYIFYHSVEHFPQDKLKPETKHPAPTSPQKRKKKSLHCNIVFLQFKFQGTFSRGCAVRKCQHVFGEYYH